VLPARVRAHEAAPQSGSSDSESLSK